MALDIVVCVKQVPGPDSLSKVTIDPAKGTINREGMPAVINPNDKNAVEEALRIREKFGGKITALTMGPPQARKALEDALAMGADSVVHLCDRAFSGADTLATAQSLACGVRKLEHFDLILCGSTTIDSATGQVPAQLAELLDLHAVTGVKELSFIDEAHIFATKVWERGTIKIKVKLPAVIAVTLEINQPRLTNIFGIMAAAKKSVETLDFACSGAELSCVGLAGSPTKFLAVSEFHAPRQGEILKGPAKEMVERAVARLRSLELI
jgi:electron transfer flavoprotein beta subunit